MVDTNRFHIGPDCVRQVIEIAALLASKQPDKAVHVLTVTTYVPLDVQSVARILESLDEEEDQQLQRVQRDGLFYYQFDGPERFVHESYDLEVGEHLEDAEGLLRTINALKSEEDWERKMTEQHQILRVAAAAKHRTIELAYFTSRLDLPSAKVQSILNDFGAEGHIELHYDEDTDTLSYTFPDLDYPEERFERNVSLQKRAEPRSETRPIWAVIALVTLALLVTILLIKISI